jgi:hypothetical protein
MNNERTFSKSTLEKMNYDHNYGSGWIKNLENIKTDESNIKLYATGDSSISTGRIYIALSANKKLTQLDKQKYNITE